jgi:hypothetical protein
LDHTWQVAYIVESDMQGGIADAGGKRRGADAIDPAGEI